MKIKGPLQSFEASGTFGPRITFSKRKSGQQARFQKSQKDSQSASQISQREKLENASFFCRHKEYGAAFYGFAFFGADDFFYNDKARSKKMSGYNLCISEVLLNT